MTRVVSATEARIHFGELMRRVSERNETVIVERGGTALAVVLSLEAYDRLVAKGQPTEWKQRVERARLTIERELAGRPLAPPEDVIREMREERDAELSRLR